MKLQIIGFEDIIFTNIENTLLIIENHKLFSKVILSLSNYIDNISIDDEIIILDNLDNIVKGNQINLILDPIHFNFNDRFLLTKIYSKISQSIINQQDIYEIFNTYISSLNNIIINELNDFNFNFSANYDLSIISYLKCLNVKVEDIKNKSIFDKILDCIDLYSEILPNQIFIFVCLLQYLDDKQIEEINKYICYKKVCCLFIENEYNRSKNFKKYIIDNEFCEQIY